MFLHRGVRSVGRASGVPLSLGKVGLAPGELGSFSLAGLGPLSLSYAFTCQFRNMSEHLLHVRHHLTGSHLMGTFILPPPRRRELRVPLQSGEQLLWLPRGGAGLRPR